MTHAEQALQRYFLYLLAIGILLNLPGLWLDVMEPDGALYATIAKHIVQHNDWINLYGNGEDWLDKPHFPFWMAAISYKIFGINGFAYKFPAFLFWLGGLYYTYLTARYLFNSSVAKISLLLYTVALHSTLANFDVRAEPFLTTCIVAAIWHMLCIYEGKSWKHIVAAAIFAACAVMTKGIFALITIWGGWVIFWALTRQWKQFYDMRWIFVFALTFVATIPELYCLYVQFDMHPEKIVFGKTGVSGLRFFFWDSQFGRFFNSGPIKGRGDITFFLHTTLWAFLPWSASLIAALVFIFRSKTKSLSPKIVIYGSTAITFLMFSLSRFQLPHYIVIVFPYFAMITGHFLFTKSAESKLGWLVVVQNIVMVLLGVAILGLLYITQVSNGVISAVVTLGIILIAVLSRLKYALSRILFTGYAMAAMLYIFLFFFFYPFLLQYQSGREAARIIPDGNMPVGTYQSLSYSFEFYSPGYVSRINTNRQLTHFLNNGPCYLYTTAAIGDSLMKTGIDAQVVDTVQNFHITKLKLGFLDHSQRKEKLQARYLMRIDDLDKKVLSNLN